MITKVTQGDIFESGAQTLVNTVNTVGVMGKGVALAFKKHYPEMFKDYERRCARGEVRLGEPYIWRPLIGQWVINFPTKSHWRAVSKLSDIRAGLEYLAHHIDEWGVESLAVPPLGAGQGQLDWQVVGPTLYRYLDALAIPVELFAPWEVPEGQLSLDFLKRAEVIDSETRVPVEPAWTALAQIAAAVNDQRHAWPVGKTRFQKLAYLATKAGLPMDLEFTAGSYGPFAPGIKSILSRLVNNGVVDEKPSGRMIRIVAGPTLEDAREAHAGFLREHREAIDRTIDLVSRLDDRQTELASTVIFVAGALRHRSGRVPTEREILDEAMRWKVRRRPPIEPHDFAESIRDMQTLGWLEAQASEDLPIDDDLLTIA